MIPLCPRKLQSLAEKTRHYNIAPLFIRSHLDEEHPVYSFYWNLVSDCVDYLKLMDEPELRAYISTLPDFSRAMLGWQWPPEHDYLERVADTHIVLALEEHRENFKDLLYGKHDETPVLKKYPELMSKLDKDQLLCIDDDFKFNSQGIGVHYKGDVIFFHQFFRRGYLGQPNLPFLRELVSYGKKSRNEVKIAVDLHRLCPEEYLEIVMELSGWYSPSFSIEDLDNPKRCGLSIIYREGQELFDLTKKVSRTEFYWSYRNGIKTLEIEEIQEEPVCKWFLNRYIHMERDTQQKVIRHFDGSINIYPQEVYKHRRESRFPQEYRAPKKVKLFRLDGTIEVEAWQKLTSSFYRNNEMVLRYLDPGLYESQFREKLQRLEAAKEDPQG